MRIRNLDVYALIDPRTNEVRYIGCTKSLARRFAIHLATGKSPSPSASASEWIAELLAANLQPKLEVLEHFSTERHGVAFEAEKQWILHYLELGAPLLNRRHAKPYRRSSKILPGREPVLAWLGDELIWTMDY